MVSLISISIHLLVGEKGNDVSSDEENTDETEPPSKIARHTDQASTPVQMLSEKSTDVVDAEISKQPLSYEVSGGTDSGVESQFWFDPDQASTSAQPMAQQPVLPKNSGKKRSRVENQFRFDGMNHWVEHDQFQSGSRCKYEKCNKTIHTFCLKCDVYLCCLGDRNCFESYHQHLE